MKFLILILVSHLMIGKSFSDQLVNEFNFSATIDGLYKLEDGRTFESSSLKGHIKNNIGNYGNIKCNSLIEKNKDKLIFLRVICESSMNDGNKVWSVLERSSSSFKAGVGDSTIIDATGKFKKLIGTKCLYAVTKFKKSSFIKEKCKLEKGVLSVLKN
ncbi:MAG: hypothetical protein CFH34_00910 [Alphaproteobacteria bacterium MarineAlpha9_Bin4]|nr:hypothetical protein [Pelagibacterales bacterium]PPR26520.1 MAG: hypothetical protein CFH34_00910 [Alphaproteobacteria bacterium MarineAlpha9_Bin4]